MAQNPLGTLQVPSPHEQQVKGGQSPKLDLYSQPQQAEQLLSKLQHPCWAKLSEEQNKASEKVKQTKRVLRKPEVTLTSPNGRVGLIRSLSWLSFLPATKF